MRNYAMKKALLPIKKEIKKFSGVTINLPKRFGFKNHGIMDFDGILKYFDWNLENTQVRIDFTECTSADYQAISLIVIYSWYLKSRGCTVDHVIDKAAYREVDQEI